MRRRLAARSPGGTADPLAAHDENCGGGAVLSRIIGPIAMAIVVLLPGCGGGKSAVAQFADDVGRAGASVVRNADELPDGSAVVRKLDIVVPPSVVQEPAPVINGLTRALLEPHVANDSEAQLKSLIRHACKAKDYYDLAQLPTQLPTQVTTITMEEAVDAVASFSGDSGQRLRAVALAKDLGEAESYGDGARKIAAYMICERV